MPRRSAGLRRRGANTQWEELVGDDGFTVWLMEAELYGHLPFRDRAGLMESYPSWRADYLEYKRQRHAGMEPQPPINQDPLIQQHLEANYQMAYRIWVSLGYSEPPLERMYQNGGGR